MEKDRIAYLLQKYINRVCTTDELKEFMELVEDAKAHTYLDELLDDYWEQAEPVALDDQKADYILRSLMAVQESAQKERYKLKVWWGWAAAIVLIGISLFFFNRTTEPKEDVVQISGTKPQLTLSSANSINVKTTDEHQKVTLPDGSTVILNKRSSIIYPKSFGAARNVVLEGEGYFDIKHDATKGFTVYTGKLKTTVLGTAFNINAYGDEENIKVTVTRGKVSVLKDDTVLGILTPNQQIIFNAKDQKSNIAKVQAKATVQWQENDFFFDDVSMEEATQILSKKFNVPISFSKNGAKKCRFTATFLKGESLDEILKVICSFNNAQYQTSAHGITITGEGC